MEWLNYHHLLYFWTVAREGTVARAAATLRLAQPTVSAQVKALEASLGERLFERTGRRLVLTEAGSVALRYADEIFSVGRELREALRGRPTGRPARLVVGVADALPKIVARRILQPALTQRAPVHLVCREDRTDRLLAELATHALDLVLTDAPVGAGIPVKAFNHLLGECGVTFFAAPALADTLRGRFPGSLDGAPLLLPAEGTTLRRDIDSWLGREDLRPVVAGEFDDNALMKAFGETGLGVFPGPSAIEREIRGQYGVRIVGRANGIRERYYAVSVERRLRHPAVVAICERARTSLFHAPPGLRRPPRGRSR